MELINKRESRSTVLHVIAGSLLIVISGLGSYVATHNQVQQAQPIVAQGN